MGYLQSEEVCAKRTESHNNLSNKDQFTQRHALLPSHKVLAHATINPAKQLNDPKLGVIAAGAYGDCLILVANPLEDCRVLDSGSKGMWGVVKDGRVVIAREEFSEKLSDGLDVCLDICE